MEKQAFIAEHTKLQEKQATLEWLSDLWLLRPVRTFLSRRDNVLQEKIEALGEANRRHVVGHCEACSRTIMEGEAGWHYEDATVCADDAPTWGEIRDMLTRPEDWVSQEAADLWRQRLADHSAAGGSDADSAAYVL